MTGQRGGGARTRPPFVTALSRCGSLCLEAHESLEKYPRVG